MRKNSVDTGKNSVDTLYNIYSYTVYDQNKKVFICKVIKTISVCIKMKLKRVLYVVYYNGWKKIENKIGLQFLS